MKDLREKTWVLGCKMLIAKYLKRLMLQEHLPCYFIFNGMKESASQFVAFNLDELLDITIFFNENHFSQLTLKDGRKGF